MRERGMDGLAQLLSEGTLLCLVHLKVCNGH